MTLTAPTLRKLSTTAQLLKAGRLWLAVLLVLAPTARAADSFSIDWFTVDGGGGEMSGGGYTLSGTLGQPDAGLRTLTNGGQWLKGGFWALDFTALAGVPPTLVIQPASAAEVILFWYPDTPGFLLQQSSTLLPDSWTTLFPVPANPVTLPIDTNRRFFRLIMP